MLHACKKCGVKYMPTVCVNEDFESDEDKGKCLINYCCPQCGEINESSAAVDNKKLLLD